MFEFVTSFPYVWIAVGFASLIYGARWTVTAATALAKRLGVSPLVIGLTIIAFGTSLPELTINLIAGSREASSIAIGNIIGANLANVLFILGLAGIMMSLRVKQSTVWKEIPLSLLAALVLFVLISRGLIDGYNYSTLTRTDGIMLLLFFSVFLYYIVQLAKATKTEQDEFEAEAMVKDKSSLHITGLLFVGFVGLFIGGQLVVESAVSLARALGWSELLISITVISFGSSLPELITTVTAALRKQADIAVGNIVGSNIFNIFFVLGLSSIINPLTIPAVVYVDLLILIFATTFLLGLIFIGERHRISRPQGVSLLVVYGLYLVFALSRG